jgi:alanyl-tRNA synthetase
MQSRDIQFIFTDFFAERGHVDVPSSSLIPPTNDPTVLLTTAGMQQMTPYFLGLEPPPGMRMTSTQKCFRTVDIDEVGDESHCTFFEMLGNFAVGDYFKRDAMRYAWDLLTKVYGIDPARLTVTVYPEDDESRRLWKEEVGDRGAQYGCGQPDCGPNCPRCSRHLEVWNLVFMGLFQEPDGTRRELENKNIDTGMGLERISTILQDVPSIYDTDLYQPIISRAAEIAGVSYKDDERSDRSLRIIADHARAVTFLIGDGVLPGNEGRGYVLRRILRRAVRHGRLLGIERPFLAAVAEAVVDEFSDRHPELHERRATILRVIANEEEAFRRTLAIGISRFEVLAQSLRDANESVIPGEEAFRLYDTFGFPFELTQELAADAGMTIDRDQFASALEQSRARSRAAVKAFADSERGRAALYAAATGAPVEFLGYDHTANDGVITDLFGTDAAVEQLDAGQPGELVLDRTVFYGESGGQVGDTGTISTETGVFVVHDTERPAPTLVVHRGEVTGGFVRVGQPAAAAIDAERRAAIRRNHTATHVLHRALRKVLGDDTHQAGSLVAPDRLRFDFTSAEPLGPDGIERVRRIANRIPLQDIDVQAETMPYAEAIRRGAIALFGEKYGDLVRVVSIGDYSAELCGGTHVARTGEIGPIVVLSESSIGSGVRRIEALTGEAALDHLARSDTVTSELARALHVPVDGLLDEVRRLGSALRERDRTIERLELALATSDIDRLVEHAVQVDGTRVIAIRVPAQDRDTMLQIGDRLRDKLRSGVIVLATEIDAQPALVAMVTRDLVGRGVNAGKLIQEIAPIVGGRGGGRPDVAQGGGSDAARLDEALASVEAIVRRQVAS